MPGVWEKLADLDNWVKRRYLILERAFGSRPFKLMEAEEALRKYGIETGSVKELLSILRKHGLVRIEKYALDHRYSIYQLVVPAEKEVTRDRLFRALKAGADLIRGGVDYKVLLVFLFYKAISDKWNSIVKKYIGEGYTHAEAYLLVNREYFVLYDEDEQKLLTWHEVTRKKETLREITNALLRIAELNDEIRELSKLVEVLGLTGFISEDNMHILEGIVKLFNELDLSQVDYDLLGEAYQWILGYFAPQKAKEGEVYTPREVIKLMVRLLDVDNGNTVLDPAAGSTAMLIESYKYVRTKLLAEGEEVTEPDLMLYAQERNEITAILAKLNLLLNNIRDYELYVGDSLVNPRFPKADYVLANPPWNQDGYGEETLSKDPKLRIIYRYGYPPNDKADWAWIQLMLAFSRKKMAVVIDQGALFRGGREKKIRRRIVETDLLEAVILLPEKLFYNAQAPGVILVFNKQKPPERKGKILFINASNEYKPHPEVRRLNILAEENIEKIVRTYREYREEPGFSRIVPLEEIR
ncbi:MAG: SAM-dependent DNA methyltransferase, partial [Thermoprotei archaeon]